METLHHEHAEKSDSDVASDLLADDRTVVKQVVSHLPAPLQVTAKLTVNERRRGLLARMEK